MNMKNILSEIQTHYAGHRVAVKLVPYPVIGSSEHLVIRVILKSGTKAKGIFDHAPDIKTALRLPILQPFKDGVDIYLAVSDKPIAQISLWEMLTSRTFRESKMSLPIALGYDMLGRMITFDLCEMPHAMYAGSTQSGKSSGLLSLVMSIIFKQPVSKANLVILDVGANSMEPLANAPHLSHPIVNDYETGFFVIQELADEMERRRKLSSSELSKLPALICVVDEYASLIDKLGNKKLSHELANSISDLLRRGTHANIHMVLATQDPTVKDRKVDIENITARMAFRCATFHNSISILGVGGAEKMPGKGAMLFQSSGHPEPLYLQGAFMGSDEIRQLVARIATAPDDFSNKFVIPKINQSPSKRLTIDALVPEPSVGNIRNELADIIFWVLSRETVSKSQIKDQFRMGNRADDVVDSLFKMKLITDKFANQPRVVIPTSFEDVSDDVKTLLTSNGITESDIVETISKRFEQKHEDGIGAEVNNQGDSQIKVDDIDNPPYVVDERPKNILNIFDYRKNQ